MTNLTTRTILLSEADNDIPEAIEDLRGRAVVDSEGDEFGDIVDVVLDRSERQARCLVVKTRDMPGFGEETYLVPMDAVEHADGAVVRVRETGRRIADGPSYDQSDDRDEHLAEVYGYYGAPPFWFDG